MSRLGGADTRRPCGLGYQAVSKNIPRRHLVKALRSCQTGAPFTRTAVRRAPVGVMPVCCKPQDSSSLLCSVVCPPVTLPNVAWWAARSSLRRRTHSPNETKPRRSAQLAAKGLLANSSKHRGNPQATTARHRLPDSQTRRLEGLGPQSGRAAAYGRICSANLPGAGSKG